MTLRVAIFGAGRIGTVHAHNAAADPGSEVVAVIDADPGAAGRLGAAVGAPVKSATETFADPSVDAVVIATPTDTHADLVEAAAAAGKATFCEKPLALDMARTRLCLQRIAPAGVPLLVGFNRRFDPNVQRLKQRITAGDVGNVELVSIMSKDPEPPPPAYLERSGGLFRDMMIHDFDMARNLLGAEPVRVSATAAALVSDATREVGDVDTAAVTLQTADGRIAVITNSRRATYGYDQRIEVHGSLGMASLNNILMSTVTLADAAGMHADPLRDFFIDRYADAYRAEWRHFISVAGNGTTPLVGGADGERALALADAALASLQSGHAVTVAPAP